MKKRRSGDEKDRKPVPVASKAATVRGDSWKIISLLGLSLLLILVLLLVLPGSRNRGGNLLFVTLDTVRADRFSCYGNEGIRTPTIDRLAAGGILFANAIAPAPLTLPSHVTMMTGLYPAVHGVRDNSTFRLSDRATTLAEILRERGYRTGAVVGAFVLDSSFGLDQGFEFYDDDFPDPARTAMMTLTGEEGRQIRLRKINERSAPSVTGTAIAWLRENAGERFFLWVHYYDPHLPYTPPEPWAAEYVNNPYDGEIAFVDRNLGEVIDELSRRDLLDETLVVIAGDHGESLGEHGEKTHGVFIYESIVRVPLILSYRGNLPRGKKIDTVVSLVDLVPTILDLLEIESETNFDGVSLVGFIEDDEPGDRAVFSESMFPYLNYGWGKLYGVREGQWKYILAPNPELYDLSEDPGETRNVMDSEREVAQELRGLLDAGIVKSQPEGSGFAESARISEEDRDRLLALGYVSGVSPDRRQAGAKDPKEMIRYHQLLVDGETAMQERKFDTAREVFEEILVADPTNAVVRNYLGSIYWQRGDTARAHAEFERAIQCNPDLPVAYQNLGNLNFHAGNLEKAAAFYEKAIELDPNDEEYYIGLAGIYEKLGVLERADGVYGAAIELGYSSPELLIARSRALVKLGRTREAIAHLGALIGKYPNYPEAHLLLGELYVTEGEKSKAREHLHRFLELGTGNERARRQAQQLLAGIE